MKPSVDLKQLAIERDIAPTTGPAKARVPNYWVSRYLVPGAILVGFLAVLGTQLADSVVGRHPVTVVPVVSKRIEGGVAGQPLFQSPGWIEPRPTAVSVPALAAGVIDQLLVVEGSDVAVGEPIARLVAVDAMLSVKQARTQLEIRNGELEEAIAGRDAAKIRLEQPVHLEADLAEAESELADAKTELGKLPQQIEKAKTQVAYAEQSLKVNRDAGSAVASIVVRRAEADLASEQATLSELLARQPNLKLSVSAQERKVAALKRQLSLLVEENRQFGEAEAKVRTATAKRDEAQVSLELRELDLERMVVRAPMSGKVLKLVSFPGDRVMGIDSTSEHRSSTVVQMYDPQQLQVRADVRLEDVPFVVPGQPVEIRTASSEQVIQGRVLMVTSSANIQKNTLEVKVALLEPPSTVTPEMLVTATFLTPQSAGSSPESFAANRMFAPESLVLDENGEQSIWVVDTEGYARRRQIRLGSAGGDGLVEVTKGLGITDKLIVRGLDGLGDAMRVAITGDDPQLGMND